jgi:hypothetical protein
MRPLIQIPAPRNFRLHRDLAILVLVVIGSAVPFLSQPFHMDDNFYMDMARSARAQGLFPYDAPYDFGGFHLPDMASHSHPPLQAYFLAAVQILVGEAEGREWAYHSAALVFPLLAAISMYFLAARFVERPIWPALALAVSPLFQVMGHTLMTDMPMLAFWLAAIASFLWATELPRTSLYGGGAVFLFAAMFTSYQAVALLPLIAFYLVRRRARPVAWLGLLLPLGVMGGWLALSSVHYGRLILGDTLAYVGSRHATTLEMIATKALALLAYQGWLILFPFFLLYIFARGLRGRLLGLSLLPVLVLAQIWVPQYRWTDKAIFVIGCVAGIFQVGQMLGFFGRAVLPGKTETDGMGRLEAQFLSLWYFGVIAYCLVIFTEGSARYILPLVPPVLLLFFRRLEMSEVVEYRLESRRWLNSAMVASGSLVLTLAWGLFLAQADYEFACIYPRAASSFSRLFPGFDAYVTGEWGFRYYFGRIGAGPLPADETRVRGGSLIVKPALALPYDLPGDLASMTLEKPLARLTFDLKTPFRVMDLQSPAGFYSTGWGLIPFSFSGRPLETLEVRQVSYMVELLPQARVEATGGILPWPGYVFRKERELAILAKPDTRITYPWTMREAAILALKVGLVYEEGSVPGGVFHFTVMFRDGVGRILARWEKTIAPGIRPEDLEWQTVKMPIPALPSGHGSLEFYYAARGDGKVTGAFADGFITPR